VSVKELLEAVYQHEETLRLQLQEAHSFALQLQTLDQDYEWVALPFERVTVGMVGIVEHQNWLFQVKEVNHNWLRVEIYDEVSFIYEYSGGEGAVWRDPDDCLETIHEAYSEDWHYEDDGYWAVSDCLFAIYKGGE
jgi:hypothetical protein